MSAGVPTLAYPCHAQVMTEQILTITSATVAPERADEVVAAYEALLATPFPDGLVRTELIHDGAGGWAIHTWWRDRATLDAMRALPEPPAAPTMFRSLGAEPSLAIRSVVRASQ